jgi:hypothetical protein
MFVLAHLYFGNGECVTMARLRLDTVLMRACRQGDKIQLLGVEPETAGTDTDISKPVRFHLGIRPSSLRYAN